MRPDNAPPPSPPTTTIPQTSRIDPASIEAKQDSEGVWTATVGDSSYSVSATGGSTRLPDGSELYVDPQTGNLFVDPAGNEPPTLVAQGDSAAPAGDAQGTDGQGTDGQGTMPAVHALATGNQGTMPA